MYKQCQDHCNQNFHTILCTLQKNWSVSLSCIYLKYLTCNFSHFLFTQMPGSFVHFTSYGTFHSTSYQTPSDGATHLPQPFQTRRRQISLASGLPDTCFISQHLVSCSDKKGQFHMSAKCPENRNWLFTSYGSELIIYGNENCSLNPLLDEIVL